MKLARNSIRILLAGAICLPALAHAQSPQKGQWRLGPPENSALLYRNDSFTTKLVDLTVCYVRYSMGGEPHPAPSVMIGQVPPVKGRVKVDLGSCNTVSYTVEPEGKVTLTFTSPEGGVATGSYQILLP